MRLVLGRTFANFGDFVKDAADDFVTVGDFVKDATDDFVTVGYEGLDILERLLSYKS